MEHIEIVSQPDHRTRAMVCVRPTFHEYDRWVVDAFPPPTKDEDYFIDQMERDLYSSSPLNQSSSWTARSIHLYNLSDADLKRLAGHYSGITWSAKIIKHKVVEKRTKDDRHMVFVDLELGSPVTQTKYALTKDHRFLITETLSNGITVGPATRTPTVGRDVTWYNEDRNEVVRGVLIVNPADEKPLLFVHASTRGWEATKHNTEADLEHIPYNIRHKVMVKRLQQERGQPLPDFMVYQYLASTLTSCGDYYVRGSVSVQG